MVDAKETIDYRSTLRKNTPFYFSYNGKTVKDGLPLSFVIDPEEWRRAKRVITTNAALYKAPEDGGMPTEKLPPSERYKSLGFGLDDVFGGNTNGYHQEINSFYDLTSWDGYAKFLSSDLGARVKRPNKSIMYRGKNNDR